MSSTSVERTLRRILSKKERLNVTDARLLHKLIMEDGYFSKTERKVVQHAIDNDLLDDPSFEIFLELMLSKPSRVDQQSIA